MLSNYTKTELIQLNVEATNWQDAICKAAQPLQEFGYITEEYIHAMIQSIEEIGPYIVITKHVAMPHAAPELGTLKLGIGITTLKEGIKFGNKDNDPVKYIFCLSAIDSSSHLQLIASLVTLLEQPDFYQLLDKAVEPTEIMNYLEKNGGNEYV